MITACDLAKYITQQRGSMSAMKLQKLVYYTHAWHLVATDGDRLLSDPIEAWEHGPVVRDLWYRHRGKTTVTADDLDGDPDQVSPQVREVVAAVLASYGDCSAAQLRASTHREAPWREAATSGQAVIGDDSMFIFYSEKAATDPHSPVLPGWAPIVLSDAEYDAMMSDVAVPDDASSLIQHVRSARAHLA